MRSTGARNAARIVLLILCGAGAHASEPDAKAPQAVTYSQSFEDRYWRRTSCDDVLPDDAPTEPLRVSESPKKLRRAELLRTNGGIVPYDKSQARLTVYGFGDARQCFAAKGFRTVSVRWFGESILLLEQNLGHIVSTEAVYDLASGAWLMRRTISYNKSLMHMRPTPQ